MWRRQFHQIARKRPDFSADGWVMSIFHGLNFLQRRHRSDDHIFMYSFYFIFFGSSRAYPHMKVNKAESYFGCLIYNCLLLLEPFPWFYHANLNVKRAAFPKLSLSQFKIDQKFQVKFVRICYRHATQFYSPKIF